MDNYLIIDKTKNKKGEDTTQLKESDGKMIIKQYSGLNSDNFVIKKFDGKQINFSFFKINGIHYININSENIIDYKRFINIQQISKIESSSDIDSIRIDNTFFGKIIIQNCDVEIFSKALSVMHDYMKHKSGYLSELMYLIFH
jgi:hypothetical protein